MKTQGAESHAIMFPTRSVGCKNFWDTKDQSVFWGYKLLLLGYKLPFPGYKNLLLTFSEVQGVSSIVQLLLTFLEGQKPARVRFHGQPKKQLQKQQKSAAHKTGKAAQRSRSSNINRKSKIQENQHKQQERASCTNNKDHQTAAAKKHQKDQQKQQKKQQKQHKHENQQHKQQHKQHKQRQKQRTKRNTISKSTSNSKSCINSTNSNENSKNSSRDTRVQKAGP